VGEAERHRALVVVAPPGAGKTTRVPPALARLGPVFLLQPRRIAARALARRIAEEEGLRLGIDVGWQVRFESRFTPETRILVATEGILTARLQSDPLLTGFRSVVLDEFHERTLHADLALAFLKQARRARGDLIVVVMSATLHAQPVAEFLEGCPVVEATARQHPVEIRYAPGLSPADGVLRALDDGSGHVLCFLPGAGDIQRAAQELAGRGPAGLDVRGLHGSMNASEQDHALAPSSGRKVVLATNLAETSLTVDGVSDVVDSGWHKVLRYDPAKGIDRLERERIPADSADQRSGRAGRTGPGRVLRLWDSRDRLRPQREPEILRVDLASALLDVMAWGESPERFEWFERPDAERLAAARLLLERLGAVEDSRVTPLGESLRRFPLHPRLARVLIEAGGSRRAAAACAVLADGRAWGAAGVSTSSDLLAAADRLDDQPPLVRAAARQLETLARQVLGHGARADDGDEGLRRSLLAGFPDRVARRREPGSPRLLLSSGTGAVLARESGVREGEFLLTLDVAGGAPGAEALVRSASLVDRAWLRATHSERAQEWTGESVRAVERDMLGSLVLAERPVAPDPETASALVLVALRSRPLDAEDEMLRRRFAFAGVPLDLEGALRRAAAGATRLPRFALRAHVPAHDAHTVDRLAPERLAVPSGRSMPLEYREDGTVFASVKLQELFGLAETPLLGPGRVPVTFLLLAPNGRPVQTTRDLRGFWNETYPQVRKELRGRYPRHPWPEDPWTATPTHRTRMRP
jgi:ATP-dependent helicase HrpB